MNQCWQTLIGLLDVVFGCPLKRKLEVRFTQFYYPFINCMCICAFMMLLSKI